MNFSNQRNSQQSLRPTGSNSVAAGHRYREHLVAHDAHESDKCLYCRQPLEPSAIELISKYSEYLADKLSTDIVALSKSISEIRQQAISIQSNDVRSYLDSRTDDQDQSSNVQLCRSVLDSLDKVRKDFDEEGELSTRSIDRSKEDLGALEDAEGEVTKEINVLRTSTESRTSTLKEKTSQLEELKARIELERSWPHIVKEVASAKEIDRLRILSKPLPGLSRSITELSKTASDQMINQNFHRYFEEECKQLRTPDLRVEYVGRQGKAQRRRTIGGRYKPSRIFSEGEQKVLALADFLAEARLTGISAPVVFDDPVSSLDHRRINEVAQRVHALAQKGQVIVFTHDILFATKLLSLFESSGSCTYYHVTDEDGVGNITPATGPRWDTLKNLRAKINSTIEAAKREEGEARAALVREGYDWIRAWCEVFAETELLQGVSQRYQPNIRMTALPKIKVNALKPTIETVTAVFDEACRYIPGHSQPLPSLSVSPTLNGLVTHWKQLQEARKAYLDAKD
ncbi:MAG: AAA family ATPase [bacterium]|nr:AAA family ATPase [bacterium]